MILNSSSVHGWRAIQQGIYLSTFVNFERCLYFSDNSQPVFPHSKKFLTVPFFPWVVPKSVFFKANQPRRPNRRPDMISLPLPKKRKGQPASLRTVLNPKRRTRYQCCTCIIYLCMRPSLFLSWQGCWYQPRAAGSCTSSWPHASVKQTLALLVFIRAKLLLATLGIRSIQSPKISRFLFDGGANVKIKSFEGEREFAVHVVKFLFE